MSRAILYEFRRTGLCLLLLCLSASACAVIQTPPVYRIALLAPFEGRYREVGYDLLYAARLALNEGGYANIELLPMDNGGSIKIARERAAALAANPAVKVAMIAGYAAVETSTQAAFGDMPIIVIGHWGAQPTTERVFILANHELDTQFDAPPQIGVTEAAEYPAPVTGSEVFALKQFPLLRDNLSAITILSSATLPAAAFTERYLASDLFVPPPGLLVTLAYDATHIAAQSINASRAQVHEGLQQIEYSGINGTIRFQDGYWANAPINAYRYDDNRQLTPFSP